MTTEPNPVDYYIPGYVNISQPKLRSKKFDDDDYDDDDDDNNNNNNKLKYSSPKNTEISLFKIKYSLPTCLCQLTTSPVD